MLQLYNTLTNQKEKFEPLNPGKVTMYVCGPTVYNYIHIGNARSAVAFDTIRRYLEYRGFEVNYVSNFTDVDDKIIKASQEMNLSVKEITEKFINAFYEDTSALNVKKATLNPRVMDNMDDITFLNKAKVLLNGKVTRTALLLLGKEENSYLFEDFIPQITWKLQENGEILDYEHFTIPFLVNVEKAKNKIRNLRYRYMVNEITLFPNEVDQYDNYTLRELLNNAIAHQDYRKHGRINILEMKEKLIFINEGTFIPQNVDKFLLDESYVPPYYRNPFLANAMVNLNMIDTAGSGIRRVFNNQKQKFFPMPDYDLSVEGRVKVTLYGKILDEKYTKMLFEKTDLDIGIVMLLDRVQKGIHITKQQSDLLKKEKLVEGRYPNLYISKEISEITDEKAKYIKNRGLSNDMYKQMIIELIKTYGKATRNEINDLLLDKMPEFLSEDKKKRRIKYLLIECLQNKEKKIKNIGSRTNSIWVLNKDN